MPGVSAPLTMRVDIKLQSLALGKKGGCVHDSGIRFSCFHHACRCDWLAGTRRFRYPVCESSKLLRNGQRVSGVVRNEDNFSVQILDSEGKFHFLLKSELQSLQYVAGSGMPTNHGQQLSTQELNDLVNYLHNVRANMNSQVDTVEE